MKEMKSLIFAVLIVLAALYLVKVFDISYPLTIISTSRSGEFSVIGEGKVEVVPDVAYIDAGVLVNNLETVEEVKSKIDEVNNKIINELKTFGIKKEDIKTINYSINPNYAYRDGESLITGYNGNVTILIKIKNISQVSSILSKVTKAGANQINGIRFSVDSPERFRQIARKKAIEDAKNQAKKLANELGIKLGRIVNISESTQNPLPAIYRELKVGGSSDNTQIEPGLQTIISTVTLYFERK